MAEITLIFDRAAIESYLGTVHRVGALGHVSAMVRSASLGERAKKRKAIRASSEPSSATIAEPSARVRPFTTSTGRVQCRTTASETVPSKDLALGGVPLNP